MKYLFIVLFIILVNPKIFGQNESDNVELNKINGKYQVIYKGESYGVDDNIIIVKPHKGVELSSYDFKIINKNKRGYYDIEIPSGNDLDEYFQKLKDMGIFQSVEFSTIGKFTTCTPNDDYFDDQWYLSYINIQEIWDLNVTGDPSVVIGVIDSSLDWEHEDIGLGTDSYQNIYLNPGEDAWSDPNDPTTGNGIDDDNNGKIDDWKGWHFKLNNNDVRTTYDHGTTVSGIISAKTNNDTGISGVGGGFGNSGLKILFCGVQNTSTGGVYSLGVDDAIDYAVEMGVKVIQMSFSIPYAGYIDEAIEDALDAGVFVVCASGNDGSSVGFPAYLSGVLSVGNLDSNYERYYDSNYGNNLDVVAPGVGIKTTTLNDGYTTSGGTSIAAPQVSAIAGLLYSLNPNLTIEEVEYAIESTAQKVGNYSYSFSSEHPNGTWNRYVGHGLVDASAAVESIISIDGSDYLCSSTSDEYQLMNIPDGCTIEWNCSSNISRTSTQGSNPCVFSNNTTYPAEGWIEATISTTCGSLIVHRDIYLNPPLYQDTELVMYLGTNIVEPYGSGVWGLEPNSNYNLRLNYTPSVGCSITDIDFNLPSNFYVYSNPLYYVSFRTPATEGIYSYSVDVTGCCGTKLGYLNGFIQVGNMYSMTFSPNPSSEETIVTIEAEDNKLDENQEWELEVYDLNQSLKSKKEKIKGKEQKISVSGWEKGIYLVRARIKDQVVYGKLVVK